jgi:hypothetical protein
MFRSGMLEEQTGIIGVPPGVSEPAYRGLLEWVYLGEHRSICLVIALAGEGGWAHLRLFLTLNMLSGRACGERVRQGRRAGIVGAERDVRGCRDVRLAAGEGHRREQRAWGI